jgi:hypothetical protein
MARFEEQLASLLESERALSMAAAAAEATAARMNRASEGASAALGFR